MTSLSAKPGFQIYKLSACKHYWLVNCVLPSLSCIIFFL